VEPVGAIGVRVFNLRSMAELIFKPLVLGSSRTAELATDPVCLEVKILTQT
jgi:hypothetical protein